MARIKKFNLNLNHLQKEKLKSKKNKNKTKTNKFNKSNNISRPKAYKEEIQTDN